MPDIEREGIFQVEVLEYGLREAKEGQSVSLSIRARIENQWNYTTQVWDSWADYGEYIAIGHINLVKKDGSLNEKQVTSLVEAIGWDGDFTALAENKFVFPKCQAVVKADTYEGKTRYRIDWLNAYDRVPGGLSNMDESKAKSLNQRLGGAVRALVGNVKRNAPPPAGGPPSPKKPEARQPAAVANGEGDVPF